MYSWSSNGKLLLTGEYLVLKGAISLTLPLKLQQSLTVVSNNTKTLKWTAQKPNGSWFTAEFDIDELREINTNNSILSNKLRDILLSVRELSPSFISGENGYDVITNLDFNPEYGFGTSSTLINNIAGWAKVDPYELLKLTFGGSGYDIACASSNGPILYQRTENEVIITNVPFNPGFKHNLYFVYLGNKQNSASSINRFNKQAKFESTDIERISELSHLIVRAGNISDFEKLIIEHELLMSRILSIPTVKSLKFKDIPGAVKSLGAWGGDFVLVTSEKPKNLFKKEMLGKGFDTVFSFEDIILTGN